MGFQVSHAIAEARWHQHAQVLDKTIVCFIELTDIYKMRNIHTILLECAMWLENYMLLASLTY